MSMINVKVAAIEQVTPAVKHFTFVRQDGAPFPVFSGGSHVVVSLNIAGRVHRNPYSLMGSPEANDQYHISVRRQEQSRGGSVFLHDKVAVGSELQITYPVNLFALSRKGHKHILIAGGIGITPFMSQIYDLKRLGADYELHYAFRSAEHGAFREQLAEMCGDKAHFYDDSLSPRMDLQALLGRQPLGTHVYVCGPGPMVVAVLEAARELGWPEKHIHNEQFLAPPIGEPFPIKLARSNIDIMVSAEMSMLEAIEAAGIEAEYLCRGGVCGRCELEVLENDGTLLHNDHYLSAAEKAAGRKIMPCVSRAKCGHLLINL